MKSQSQLQQQSATAAIQKKTQAATSGRRLRRNVDVVVNALAAKNRSQSSNLIHQSSIPQNQHQTHQQQPYNQFYPRKPAGGSQSSIHSHSQHVLDNSQAIQAKINMYTNQAQAKKLQQPVPSGTPMSNVANHHPKKNSSSKSGGKLVPAQLSRAFLAQRANQTPTPVTQQHLQNTRDHSGNQFNQNIQQQLSNLVSKRNNDRNGTNQNLLTAYNQGLLYNNTNSSYHEVRTASQPGGVKLPQNHYNSTHNLNQSQRAGSQLSQGSRAVNMKGSQKSGRNAYISTLSNRQKSTKQFNQSNTLYSQISLKEINSPVKQLQLKQKVSTTQRMTGVNFYGGNNSAKLKQSGSSNSYLQSSAAQAFEQYGAQQPVHEMNDLKDIQQMMENMQPAEQNHQRSNSRSRNISNMITTNGVTAHSQGPQSQGAILNINTASDINIYNNSFIVQTSPGHQAQAASSGQRQASIKRVTSTNKPGRGGKSNLTSQGRSSNNQVSNHQSSYNGGARSLSTGRNQKSAQGSRGVTKVSSKTSRGQAVNEAYSQNRNYVINNQILQPTGQPLNKGVGLQNVPQPAINSKSVYSQPIGSKVGKGYNSTENIKRSEDSQLGINPSDEYQRNSSLNNPQYNNLVNDSQKRLKFAQESGLAVSGKRNFKSVKRSRDAFSTQTVSAMRNTESQRNGQFATQKTLGGNRSADLIIKGRAKIKAKEYAEAVKLFTEVLDSIDANNITAIFYRGVAYLDQGNLQQAINELWRVVDQKQSENAQDIELCQQAYVLLSIAHKRLGESKNAIQDLQQCIETFPSYSEAYLARGQTLLLQEEFQDALSDFQKYLKLNKDSAFSGYLGVGDCHKALKSYELASQAYKEAIKLLPQMQDRPNYTHLFQQCYMKRGLSGYHEGDHKQALADLQTVIQKDSSNVKAHFYIGKLLAKGVENEFSKKKDAVIHFEQVAKYPDQEFYSGNALFQIAKLRLRQKDYYEAFHCLKRAADNNFSSKRLSLFKDFAEGVLYLIKRKIKKGVQILSDLLEILVNKDKEDKQKEQDGKATIDWKKRHADKMHSDYLIHQILIYRAYGYVAIEKYEMAHDDIRRVPRYGKIDIATIYNKWLGKGILRMDHEDYLMASKFFSKAWKKYPANKDPYCLQVISIVRSYSYSMGGYFIDQQVKFDKVMETKKFMDKAIMNCCSGEQKEPSLYFFRGLLNFQMHHFYEALADFNKAIEIEEESSAHYFLARGRTYACLSILTEAMKDLSVALNLDETLQQAYIYRGKCAYLIGDNNLAFLDFQRLILTDPKNPMVHVYAGNLLMTTGAYQDAIKAYENADTVEPTTISSFQRVRCFCALSDLENAKILLDNTQKMQSDDLMLKFDSICLDELIRVSKASETMNKPSLTPANVKSTDKTLREAISTFDELLTTYESEKLQQLKRRDSILNIQVIPNVERIKIEKLMVAKDFNKQKEQLPLEQQADYPTLTIDYDAPMNIQARKRLSPYSYYYENIFGIEDFLLYRGVFKFYSQRYADAVVDFQQALQAHQETSDNTGSGPDEQGKRSLGRYSGLNTKNPTLQHYTLKSGQQTLESNATDLSDIGLSSFHEVEINYNILLAYIFANDKPRALEKLNELQKKVPRKYGKWVPLLRLITLDHFGEKDKVKQELKALQKYDQTLYEKIFNTKGKKTPYAFEMFPSEGRLCSQFTYTNIRLRSGLSQTEGVIIQIRLSFSMPFIKPPNMIPNVDEDIVQSEFNLKQIDAPMPEAPWIKRCGHGINFTNQITKDGREKDKYRKFFEESKDGKSGVKQCPSTTEARLLNNSVGDNVSDRHKISLAEDSSRIYNEEEDCQEERCAANEPDLNVTNMVTDDDCSEMPPADSDESYDSEDFAQKTQTAVMAIRASENLLPAERESLVNMGENIAKNNIREIKQMRKEIVDPNIGQQKPGKLLPKVEETKNVTTTKRTLDRYAADQEDEFEGYNGEAGHLPQTDSQMQSARHKSSKLLASQQLVQATEAEPRGLDELAREPRKGKNKRVRERRVSNLSLGLNLETPQKRGTKNPKDNTNEDNMRRSKFRSSIDDDCEP